MKNKYPVDLFIIGFISNIFSSLLFLPSVVLLIAGIWVKACLIIGSVLFALDIVLSFIEQLKIRNATLYSDNPNFSEFQKAILSKNWKNNIKDIVDDKINENHEDDEQDDN